MPQFDVQGGPVALRTRLAQYMNPVLHALRELGGSARPGEVYDWVAEHLPVSEAERAEKNKSGSPRFENDVAWARFYLVAMGYLDSSKRGVWSLTELGRNAGTLSDEQILGILRQVIERTSRMRK